jgi:pimeloyl-ACP methyl ester carboxylesterase
MGASAFLAKNASFQEIIVAQKLALGRPDLVARLVLVSTGHGGKGQEWMSPGAMADVRPRSL